MTRDTGAWRKAVAWAIGDALLLAIFQSFKFVDPGSAAGRRKAPATEGDATTP